MISFNHNGIRATLQPGQTWVKISADSEFYRDTAVDTLRTIIAAVEQGVPWREVVAKHYAQSQPWLHQIITSPARDLFFRQHPPPAGARVLDIGAGWGQIALPLARRPDLQVTALEPTPERIAFIRAAALQEKSADRMHFIQADFQDIAFDPVFDLACCIGVLEWIPKFRSGDPHIVQLNFLRRLRSALRPGGQCCLGIENRFGLKYLLGARDDHTGQRNVSVFDAALATAKHYSLTGQDLRTFTYTHAEYEALFREAGFASIETYAAFPDYKLPELILPCTPAMKLNQAILDTPLPHEHDGLDGHPLAYPEEYLSHYRSLARLGPAQFFCPSFFFVLK